MRLLLRREQNLVVNHSEAQDCSTALETTTCENRTLVQSSANAMTESVAGMQRALRVIGSSASPVGMPNPRTHRTYVHCDDDTSRTLQHILVTCATSAQQGHDIFTNRRRNQKRTG